MLKREYGRIINVTSVSGLQASTNGPHYAGYAASKAGLFGLTRELAASWGGKAFASTASRRAFSIRDLPTLLCR
jgi:NAD(P)-dependent dehydrogenase (short-subunit alcohol dehydrogenase family)